MKTTRLTRNLSLALAVVSALVPAASHAISGADSTALTNDSIYYIENDQDCGTSSTSSGSGSSNITISYTDPARANRAVNLTVYLPSDSQPHPLLMFAPGRDQNAQPSGMYGRYQAAIASQGFVVAGVNFIDNHSAAVWSQDAQDINFAINDLLSDPQLSGKIDKSSGVGVFGHSDGGAVAMQVGYGGAQNSHVKAIVAASGANGGTNAGPPLFVMYGDKDFNSGGGEGSYESVNPSYKARAIFKGATHTGYLTTDQGAASTKYNSVADALTAAFFKRFLEGSTTNTDLKTIATTSTYADVVTFSEVGTNTPAGAADGSTSSSSGSSTCCADSATSGTGTLPAGVPAPYNAIFTAAANEAGADPLIVATIFLTENGFVFPNPPPPYGTGPQWPTSPAAASGPFQFIPPTWASHSQGGNINDLKDASGAAARFIVELGGKAGIPLGSFATSMTAKPSVANVLGSYNAGPAGNFNNSETTNYITKGLQIYTSLKSGGSGTPAATTATTSTTDASSCADSGTGSGSVADIIKTAEGYAWPDFQNYRSIAEPSYQAVFDKYVIPKTGAGIGLNTDCSQYIGQVMIQSGADKDFPISGTAIDLTYVKAHPEKYDIIPHPTSTSQLKPGDILVHDEGGGDGHIMVYIGDSHWQGADASRGSHTPQVSPNVTWIFDYPSDVVARLK